MWTGTQWVPAPPENTPQAEVATPSAIGQDSDELEITAESEAAFVIAYFVPIITVILSTISLFMPYLSLPMLFGLLDLSISGIEIIETWFSIDAWYSTESASNHTIVGYEGSALSDAPTPLGMMLLSIYPLLVFFCISTSFLDILSLGKDRVRKYIAGASQTVFGAALVLVAIAHFTLGVILILPIGLAIWYTSKVQGGLHVSAGIVEFSIGCALILSWWDSIYLEFELLGAGFWIAWISSILKMLTWIGLIPDVDGVEGHAGSSGSKDEFFEFFEIVDKLLGDMPTETTQTFLASDSFKLYERVGADPSSADEETRAQFFSMINAELNKLPESYRDQFAESPGFELFTKMDRLYGR